MLYLLNATDWIRQTAAKAGIKTGNFEITMNPSHDSAGVFTPGKLRVWNTRKEIVLTFGTDLNNVIVTNENVWEMTR